MFHVLTTVLICDVALKLTSNITVAYIVLLRDNDLQMSINTVLTFFIHICGKLQLQGHTPLKRRHIF